MKPIQVKPDPDNRHTIILSRWPTEEEKRSPAFQKQMDKAGRRERFPVDEERAPEKETAPEGAVTEKGSVE